MTEATVQTSLRVEVARGGAAGSGTGRLIGRREQLGGGDAERDADVLEAVRGEPRLTALDPADRPLVRADLLGQRLARHARLLTGKSDTPADLLR